ncbi:hypothetical protein [Anaeromyxobacter oryzae]|nr:hypothetical protein [Anaeromyxobacter oryzae]
MSSARPRRAPSECREAQMLDALFVLLSVAFFAGALAYVAGCDRL